MNEGGRVATPTSFSIFDSYDMKSLGFKFGHDIFSGFKKPRLISKKCYNAHSYRIWPHCEN